MAGERAAFRSAAGILVLVCSLALPGCGGDVGRTGSADDKEMQVENDTPNGMPVEESWCWCCRYM